MTFAVKSTSCSFRKPWFNFQHLHDVLWNHLQLQSQGSNALFWPLQTVWAHGALTHTHRTYKKVSFPFPSFLLWLFFKGKNELQSFLAALIQGVKTLRRNYLCAQNSKKRYLFFLKKSELEKRMTPETSKRLPKQQVTCELHMHEVGLRQEALTSRTEQRHQPLHLCSSEPGNSMFCTVQCKMFNDTSDLYPLHVDLQWLQIPRDHTVGRIYGVWVMYRSKLTLIKIWKGKKSCLQTGILKICSRKLIWLVICKNNNNHLK